MAKLKSVLIVGCGKMGAFYDSPHSPKPLSYAHILKKLNWVDQIGFLDNNYDAAREAAQVWGGESYQSFDDLDYSYDICVIASPDTTHYQILKDVCTRTQIKAIVLEKPIATDIDDAYEMEAIIEANQIQVFVNYSRAYLPEIQKLKEKIDNCDYGRFLFGTGIYGKGLLHNGSHLLNLIQNLLGDIKDFLPTGILLDYQDPSIPGVITLVTGEKLFVNCVPQDAYTVFELDLVFEFGRVKLLDSTRYIEYWEPFKSDIYTDYKYLKLVDKKDTGLEDSLHYLFINVEETLEKGGLPKCSMKEALKLMEVWNRARLSTISL